MLGLSTDYESVEVDILHQLLGVSSHVLVVVV